MLNITNRQSIREYVNENDYSSFGMMKTSHFLRQFIWWVFALLGILVLFCFLPWRQTVTSKGYVTTLMPEQRPQVIPSIIDGRIEKWYVREGDYVQRGDTIAKITDVKDDYMDPNLTVRTEEQLNAKRGSADSYIEKARAMDEQIAALVNTREAKLSQARLYLQNARFKIKQDSANVVSARVSYENSEIQYEQGQTAFEADLMSSRKVENRLSKMREAEAKLENAINKLLSSRNELINARTELQQLRASYEDKIAKARGEKASALSSYFAATGDASKLENQLSTYEIRAGYHYIKAPQNGFVTEALTTGIGELIKSGKELVSIMPSDIDYAVEMFVEPVDIPLFDTDELVRFTFDGWPAVVFSGWPDLSFGTFEGKVVAIDKFVNKDGEFRVLVAENEDYRPWPVALRVGAGAKGFALLKTVPVWYEIWRKLNGFPPDYYRPVEDKGLEKSDVKTLKKLK